MRIIKNVIALILSATLTIAWADQANQEKSAGASIADMTSNSSKTRMQVMHDHMKNMQKTMDQMFKAKSENQRSQLMGNHMNQMIEGMNMMGSMMNMTSVMDDQKGAISSKIIMQQHREMDQRMDMMQSMMRHIMSQQSMLMRDRNIIMRDRNLIK